jgi:hypothetical protein
LVKYFFTDQNIKFYGLSLPLATHADACCLFVGEGVRSKRLTEIVFFFKNKNDPESFTTCLRRLNI